MHGIGTLPREKHRSRSTAEYRDLWHRVPGRSILVAPACGKKLTTEEAEKLLRDSYGAQHDVTCSYTFDKVATLPGYSLNSDKDKCGEKLRRAGLAELGHFLEASDAREHPWESVIEAKSPARSAAFPTRPSTPCFSRRLASVITL